MHDEGPSFMARWVQDSQSANFSTGLFQEKTDTFPSA
jgi:hypothetical protein